MAANPVTYAEIDAYSRLHGLGITPWEISVIRRLDEVVLINATKKVSGKENVRNEIDASDGVGVMGLMKGLGAKATPDRGKRPALVLSPARQEA